MKPVPIVEEKAVVFKDDRTSMVITDRFSEFGLTEEPKKKKPEAKKSTVTWEFCRLEVTIQVV